MPKNRLFGMMTLIIGVILIATLIGCDDNNADNSGGEIINRSGEAWVGEDEFATAGFIFKTNGTVDAIIEDFANYWYIAFSATYSTRGSTLSMTMAGQSQQTDYSYSISNNRLTITDTIGAQSVTFTFVRKIINLGEWIPPSNHIPLTEGQWMNGTIISSSSSVTYSFYANKGTAYNIWVEDGFNWIDNDDGNDSYIYPSSSYTGDVGIRAYYSDFSQIWDDRLTQYDIWDYPASFTANTSGIVYIVVAPNGTAGTFRIVYSTGSTRP